MENFAKRKDRFDFFESFENPLLNITYKLETPDFLSFCKEEKIPVFHFFLFCIMKTLNQSDNFKYRYFNGEVIKIDEIYGSYTTINEENLFNYTRFEHSDELSIFIERSLASKEEAMKATGLINTGIELSPREMKNYVFITSLPWLEFTSIQHPVYKFKSADIPALAWGKFTKTEDGKITMPFSIQAHHGFIDGFHINEFGVVLNNVISEEIINNRRKR